MIVMLEIRNLLFNPRPGVPGCEEFENIAEDAIVTYLPNGVKVTTQSMGAGAVRGITLPAGDWVYSAFVGNYTGSDECTVPGNIGLAVSTDTTPVYVPFTGVDKRYTLQFHLDAEDTARLLLPGPSTVGESLSWSGMILASKQDYDAMRALTDANGQPLNLEWFDGDTYPRNSGGDSAS